MNYLLDLGTTKVACLATQLDEHGEASAKAATDVPCKGLTRGVISDIDLAAHAIDDVMRRIRTTTHEAPSHLTVSINGSHIESINAQGFVPIYPRSRMITREDVLHVINHSRQVMPLPDREQVMAIPREFRVDGTKVARPVGMSGGRLEVVTHIVMAQSAHLQNVEKAVQMAGYKVDEVIVQPAASGLGVTSEQDRELGCAVADIGGGCTTLSVYQGGALAYSCVLPVGSALVTSDLSKLLKTSIEEAERLKTTSGVAHARSSESMGSVEVLQIGQSQSRHLDRKVLCEIIESRMREIATLVKQQIEKSGLNGLLPGGLIITGGGSRLIGTDELFGSVIPHMQIRVARPKMPGTYASRVNQPEWAGLVGMARHVLQKEEDEIEPASTVENIKVKMRSLKALFSTK